ncbi:BREX-1 system phosphatase PglZ type B [Thalassolituus hydrocarboniclasticus]|uniref:BREX-1 system phosphatase PglZ type B n=1 Tax=Thalassolituus hydrocarboniclasticus TaxID=2742796 RepID=A0ABY6AES0_9GAMM|nr:BREX-1 system phosphatase PglZ type B [Thalassolituus hydrocarboniclasticus]UXD88964.1 BREX-1 system phosphatase PglZ type B [Thalassolituus hydrocarboniclasticus]
MKLIDLLSQEVRASAEYNASAQLAPSVILWTDKLRQWESALPLLQAALPELVVFGDYQPEKRQGPAVWIKCVIENALPEFQLPEDKTPIIYLPGLERRDLRAISSCPVTLMPLAELQYRGCWWAYNSTGRDWTVNAFLTSANGGAGLDVARDEKTQQAMLRVLNEMLESDQAELESRRLEAADFNKLISNDPVRDLLTWMNDSRATRERWDQSRWQALCGICETEYHFSPERDGDITAAELLCQRQGIWETVWQRFVEGATHYPKLPALLMSVSYDLAADGESYPAINQSEEAALEAALRKLLDKQTSDVRQGILSLERQHADRRGWVWTQLGLSPLASVLEPLAVVANLTQNAFSGTMPEEMATQYRELYWQTDDAYLRVLAFSLPPALQELVQKLLHHVYTPWLDDITLSFQKLVQVKGYPGSGSTKEEVGNYQPAGELVFFVDGLRYDTAQRLVKRLQPLGNVSLKSSWAALPSVTATAKAAVTPVTDRITGRISDVDFEPSLKEDDKDFSAHYLKKFLAEKGWDYLSESETGNPTRNAWVQSGDIDTEGHVKGIKLAARIDTLLHEVTERVEELLAAGWTKIRIVTDHGWILTPEPMQKTDLPKHLTETRWGRCAVLKESASSGMLEVGWYWNPQVTIAMAPGARCFKAGQCYDHGGLSLQECLTPMIELVSTKSSRQKTVQAKVGDVRWMGLKCRIKVEADDANVVAVLRTHAGDASSEICNRKPVKEGKCTLMVEDDRYEQQTAVLVLLDEHDTVLAKTATLVGEE